MNPAGRECLRTGIGFIARHMERDLLAFWDYSERIAAVNSNGQRK